MVDNNTFLLSLQPILLSTSILISCYFPDLFNHINNTIMDIYGNMKLSGDISVYDNAYISENLTVTNDSIVKGNSTVMNKNFDDYTFFPTDKQMLDRVTNPKYTIEEFASDNW